MPYIDSKITVRLNDRKKEEIKSALGKLIATLGKSEDYLMVGIEDSYDLWFGGNKLEKGAYVEVKVLGSVDAGGSDKMTAKVCEILEKELGIPSNAVYVSYLGTGCWGWNARSGRNA